MTAAIKLLVVDDHALFRRGVVELLREQPDFVVLGEASNGSEALQISQHLQPDVVLLDVHMPGDSGVQVIPALKQNSNLRILMLTISEKDEDLLAAIEAGADGYLLKSVEPDELCQAIRQVAAGRAILSPEVTATVMKAATQSRSRPAQAILSRREYEVLAELARGATTAEIAASLIISQNTVKTHIGRILEKLAAANRAEAVSRAMALGLFDPKL